VIGTPDLDSEHFYHIDCPDRFTFINYAAGFIECEVEHRLHPYTLGQFRDLINKQRTTCNATLKRVADIDPYYAALEAFKPLE